MIIRPYLYFPIRKTYRSLQAELNKLKSEIDAKLDEKHKAFLEDYRVKLKEVQAARREVLLARSREIKALKLVLPEALKEIFIKVNAVASSK